MKPIDVCFSLCYRGLPLVTIEESPLTYLGAELRSQQLREIAAALVQIADDSDARGRNPRDQRRSYQVGAVPVPEQPLVGHPAGGVKEGSRSFEIRERALEAGGGWNLDLYEDGKLMGGGAFPDLEDDDDGYSDALEDGQAWLDAGNRE